MKYTNEDLVKVYRYLEENPTASYEDIEKLFTPNKINPNSLVKRLQRSGCIKLERDIDSLTGKIKGTRKICVREP